MHTFLTDFHGMQNDDDLGRIQKAVLSLSYFAKNIYANVHPLRKGNDAGPFFEQSQYFLWKDEGMISKVKIFWTQERPIKSFFFIIIFSKQIGLMHMLT